MIAGFEFGCAAPLLLRHERVGDGAAPAWRLLFASDLHLTARRRFLGERLAAAARRAAPDVVLLGGDLVDRASGLPALQQAVGALAREAPVAAVPGNHDVRVGITAVRDAVRGSGGHWLPDHDLQLERAGAPALQLHTVARRASTRHTLRALVGHHPSIGEAAAAHGYDVAFAGHLHGGQCVWWQRGDRLYPGAWFSRWNGLRFRLGRTTLLVSRGAADTLPLRFCCPREVLCCELAGGAS